MAYVSSPLVVGNRKFRMCIESHLDDYMRVKGRQHKSKIVTTIVRDIRNAAAHSGGGFVRKVRRKERYVASKPKKKTDFLLFIFSFRTC